MAGKRKLEIILAGDAKGLSRALGTSQGAASKFESRMGKWGRSLAKIGRSAAIGLGAVGVGVAAGLADALGEAREAAKIQALTDQVIKSTGGAAHVTSEQVAGFAESLSQLIGVDDEVIQGAENLLLTFTNVRNEAGAGNDIFNQTTVAAMDMATALGVDANGAALQLGKALNDPIKGVTKLTRAGVTFSDEQKEMIKDLQESGDVLGAQKIILAEVGKEFGGAAAAAATPMDRLKVTVGNLKEKIGAALIPIVDKAAVWLSENLPGALEKAGRFFDEHLKEPLETVRKVVATFVKNIGEKGLGGALKALPGPVKVIAAAVAALGVAIWAATAPISLIVAALAAVGVAVYAAYKRFPAFRAAVQAVVDYVKKHWPKVKEIIGKVLAAVRAVIKKAVEIIVALWRRFGDTILTHIRATWANVKHAIQGALNAVRGIIKTVTSLIRGDWSGAWNGIKQVFSGVWQAIRSIVGQAIQNVKTYLSLAWDAIGDRVTKVWEGIKTTVGDAIGAIVGFVTDLPTKITDLAGKVGDAALGIGSTIVDKLGEGLSAVTGFVGDIAGAVGKALKDAINDLIDLLNDGIPNRLGWGRLSIDIPDNPIPRLHSGGVFRAPRPGGEGLALLEDGERVIPAGRSRGGGGAVNAYITINAGLGTDQRELRRTVAKALIEYASANGGIPLKIRSA